MIHPWIENKPHSSMELSVVFDPWGSVAAMTLVLILWLAVARSAAQEPADITPAKLAS